MTKKRPIPTSDITGLVLAGGRATRMGGVDKGLQNYRGLPLALHALLRLAPQVGEVLLNANRNLAAYESMGAPVWPDASGDFAGPLAGMLAGLEHCTTPYLVTVPCDSPHFPLDLVDRLGAELLGAEAQIAMAATRDIDPKAAAPTHGASPPADAARLQVQPVFCLMHTSLLESLVAFLHRGERKIDRWSAQHRCVNVVFEDAEAFFNANTLVELQSLQTGSP